MVTARVAWSICLLSSFWNGHAALAGQAQSSLSFDVASVKVNKSGDTRTGGRLAGDRFSMVNETLWRVIGEAYATSDTLPRGRIIGGPSWIETERFDVEGVAPSPLSREQARLMLRALLADRFRLVAHTATRDLPIYALVLARSDKRLGPQLQRSNTDCAATPRAATASAPEQPSNAPRPCVMRFGFGLLAANGMTVTQLASMGLSRYAGRTVTDHTDLTGPFDWTLTWTPDNLPQRAPGIPADEPLRVNGLTVDPNGPSLFTALQEQLGLKLESTNGPVEVVVIDRVEHPTEN